MSVTTLRSILQKLKRLDLLIQELKILKIQNERRKWDILRRKYFYTFKNKHAGKIGMYQTAAEGESLRLISFKLYMDHIRAYDLQKLNLG